LRNNAFVNKMKPRKPKNKSEVNRQDTCEALKSLAK
jgi:hypothetical protein